MPYTYSIHPQFNLLWIKRIGVITSEDIKALIAESQADSETSTEMAILEDFRLAEQIDLGFTEMVPIAENSKKLGWGRELPTKMAFVAPTPVTFGMARMFQSLMAGQDRIAIEICKTIDAAVDFLGLPEEARALLANPAAE